MPAPANPVRANRITGLLLFVAFWIGSGCRPAVPRATSSRTHQREIRALMDSGKFDEAESKTLNLLAADPAQPNLLLLSAEIALAAERYGVAAERFQSAAKQLKGVMVEDALVRGAGAAALDSDLFLAIDLLAAVVDRTPQEAKPRRELAGLLLRVGSTLEGQKQLDWLLKMSDARPDELIVLADRTRLQVQEGEIVAALSKHPEDLRPQVGMARIKIIHSEWDEAYRLIHPVARQHPDYVPARVAEGRTLVQLQRWDDFRRWFVENASRCREDPEYWLVLGLAAHALDDPQGAARAVWETLRRDPGHAEAARLLPVYSQSLGLDEVAREADVHAARIDRLLDRLDFFIRGKRASVSAAYEASLRLLELGRVWEAEGWARTALGLASAAQPQEAGDHVPLAQLKQHHAQCLSLLRPDLPLVLPEHHPNRWEKHFASLLEPRFDVNDLARSAPQSRTLDLAQARIQFEDQAPSRGIEFTFQSGDDPREPGAHIYQANGSGVAVLDYDLNGWPDLYFPQGGGTRGKLDSPPHQLFANHFGQFTSIADRAHADHRGFGQGAGVGDYNEDGFPDLVLGQVGGLILLRNNGDGTFHDVTTEAGVHSDRWNTSMVLADLTGDGICDLYETTYCDARSDFEIPCYGGPDGKQIMTCVPTAFPADDDHLWKGNGDGTFHELAPTALTTPLPGRGLGALAADFDGRPGLEIFVANDMTANHFWVPHVEEGGVVFRDEAGIRGLANDIRGRPQASMGIAAGDPDRDGDLDLEVTAFEDEPDAYYTQIAPGIFEDRAQSSGIYQPSFKPLAFGDQFADFNGDGFVDLFVANGHVYDDLNKPDSVYRQTPQIYTYADGWHDISDQGGPFMTEKHIGRGLSLIDANRDHWPDLAFVDLMASSSLLINTSPHPSSPLAIELVADQSARDAVGARIELLDQPLPDVRFVTAGDGFQGSNERRSWFAIPHDAAVRIRVSWPSGNTTEHGDLKSGCYLLRERDGSSIRRE